MSDLKLGWLLVIGIISCIILFNGIKSAIHNGFHSSDEIPIVVKSMPTTQPEKSISKPLTRTYLTKGKCLASTSEDNQHELVQVCNDNNEAALKLMILTGRAMVLPPDIKVFRISGFLSYKVRVLSGVHTNQIIYIAPEFLQPD